MRAQRARNPLVATIVLLGPNYKERLVLVHMLLCPSLSDYFAKKKKIFVRLSLRQSRRPEHWLGFLALVQTCSD